MTGFVFHLTELTRGTEDLFIPALRAGLENFWLTASGGRMIENSEFTIQPIDVASAVLPVYDMLNHLHNHLPGRVHEFVTASAELGIIEVLARGFVLIKEEPSFEEDGLFRQLYMACTNFGSTLAMVDPAEFRVSIFAPAFPDWYKALRYMRARDGMFNTHTQRRSWYYDAEFAWAKTIAEYLEYDEEVQGADVLSSGCMYPRCPDPDTPTGVRFECPCNQGVVYCGYRCQNA
ncbi:hypothetical protein FRC09_005111 [Ceratobasidium sp. 395]|nr:hypothetical protein FRC09_005111 [Ceratobasidium sp. 395]